MTGLISMIFFQTFRSAAPICICASGAVCSGLSGVLNIGLEGMMLGGAFACAAVTHITGNPWAGLAAGTGTGCVLAWLHGVISIRFKGNQLVSGVAVNFFALGITEFLMPVIFCGPDAEQIRKLPSRGVISPLVVIMFFICIGTHFLIYRTKAGLRMRAAGIHPEAARSVGIDVVKIRYTGVLISGACAGIAGAYLSLEVFSQFSTGITAGRGFIALAAAATGGWTPLGALAAGLLFGLYNMSGLLGEQFFSAVPGPLFSILPYLLTLVTVAAVSAVKAPAAAYRIPYITKEDRRQAGFGSPRL